MSFGSHNPELLDEVTTKFLPKKWKGKVKSGKIDLCNLPIKTVDKAMDEGLADYWGTLIDEAMLKAKDKKIGVLNHENTT